MAIKLSNNATSKPTLAIAPGDTSFSVLSTQGALFPATTNGQYFFVTLSEGANTEIVRVKTRSSDTFSVIERAQDGTTAQSFSAAAVVSLRATNQVLLEMSPEQNELYWMSI